jgi:hypothetical protein
MALRPIGGWPRAAAPTPLARPSLRSAQGREPLIPRRWWLSPRLLHRIPLGRDIDRGRRWLGANRPLTAIRVRAVDDQAGGKRRSLLPSATASTRIASTSRRQSCRRIRSKQAERALLMLEDQNIPQCEVDNERVFITPIIYSWNGFFANLLSTHG